MSRARWSLFPFVAWAALGAAACAPPPRPQILADVAVVREGTAAKEAKVIAQAAFANAENLRNDAERAYADGDLVGAQFLGERALAAYAHAHAVARIARAETEAEKARAELAKAQAELVRIEADQARVQAELDALDLKIKVARDAQPLLASGPADPEREAARREAARALGVQARVLCAAARLLAAGETKPDTDAAKLKTRIDEATQAVDKLEASLGPTATLAPIDGASRARAGCLSVLTEVRRSLTQVSKAGGAGDALLSELSQKGGWSPSRDDRGVYVTLRNLWNGDALSAAGETRISEAAKIATAHPTFPVAVVVHHDKPPTDKEKTSLQARADAVVASLKKAGLTRVGSVVAGSGAPVVDPNGKDRSRNARVEIVFVTPEAF